MHPKTEHLHRPSTNLYLGSFDDTLRQNYWLVPVMVLCLRTVRYGLLIGKMQSSKTNCSVNTKSVDRQ